MDEYRIIHKGTGKWLLQFRAKHEKNWRYLCDGKTPLLCFKKMDYTAGLNLDIVFRIILEDKENGNITKG